MKAALRLFAIGGGILFAGSMAYGLHFYVTVLGREGSTEAVPRKLLVDIALFVLFASHHSALARGPIKRALSGVVPPAAERTLYVWIASGLWLLVLQGWQSLPGTLYAISGPGRFAGYAVQIAGVVLTLVGATAIRLFGLAGIDQASGGPAAGELRVGGPFRLVRHPIYLAWILMVCATPVMTFNRLVFAIVSSAYVIVAIPWEERSLIAMFGARYRAYQQRVRWHVLPGIW